MGYLQRWGKRTSWEKEDRRKNGLLTTSMAFILPHEGTADVSVKRRELVHTLVQVSPWHTNAPPGYSPQETRVRERLTGRGATSASSSVPSAASPSASPRQLYAPSAHRCTPFIQA